MKLSIVVPTLDEAPRIAAFLSSLAPARAQGHEIIVVDGGSRDTTPQIAAPHADRVLLAPRGRAVQMNVGASVAHGDLLLFLHADCRLPSGFAEAIGRSLGSGRRWGRFDVTLEGNSHMLPVIGALMNLRSSATGICTGDQGIFVERALFDAVGGFATIPLMEDVAISRTLKERAGRPAVIPDRMRVSGRRWDERGAWRTITQMWGLRFEFWRGGDPRELARRYYDRAPTPGTVLQIFAKAPVAGRVKTRLAAVIGGVAAARLYGRLVDRTLVTALASRHAGVVQDIELWVASEADRDAYAQWCAEHDAVLRVQRGEDLGERMRVALRSAVERGRAALLIGTDVPGYDVAYLAHAASVLQSNDAVFGPAEDGGYVLVGLKRDIDAFSGIAWSTSGVMAATRQRIAAAGATWTELPALWDIDTAQDLSRWERLSGDTSFTPS